MSRLTALSVEISDLKCTRFESPTPHLLFLVGNTKVRAFEAPHRGIRLENLDTDGDWQPAGTTYGENDPYTVVAAATAIRALTEPGEPAYTEEIDFLAALAAELKEIRTSTETVGDEVFLTALSDAPEADVMVLLDYDDDENLLASVVPGFIVDDEPVSPADLGLRGPVTLPASDVAAVAAQIRQELDDLGDLMIEVFDAMDAAEEA
ncbi:hypothetical protein [Nocardioides yefusunii]|uniref:Uncharacterized protein n=1 Tax=Nocardioides yefusunii TaxID=2500546 RepID=A0ABW1QV51_9ACTN|nr:hypothetical protein [Nocardioides yefusunii]